MSNGFIKIMKSIFINIAFLNNNKKMNEHTNILREKCRK